jgi:hypothetical protein
MGMNAATETKRYTNNIVNVLKHLSLPSMYLSIPRVKVRYSPVKAKMIPVSTRHE